MQTSANQGGGGCLKPANVCKNTLKSQQTLKTFTKILLDKEYCQDFHIAILDQVSPNGGLFHNAFLWCEKNIKGNLPDDKQSKGGGGMVANLII